MNIISFPNIGINELKINETAFELFTRPVQWYGIILTLGIVAACLYVYLRAKKYGVITDDFLDLAIYTVVFGIVGARLYYVLTSLEEYDSFYDVIAIWEGGIAMYGSIIGGGLALLIVLRYKKMNILKFFDCACPAVMLGQIIGRWGNFVNGEAYGSPDKFEFFGKVFDINAQNVPLIMEIRDTYGSSVLCQPTFLYESLWNLVGFVIINILFDKRKYDGQACIWYFTWYGFGRMFIEGLRTDSLYVGNIKISQLIGLLCFVAGVIVLVVCKVKKLNKDNPLYAIEKAENNTEKTMEV